MTPQEALEEKEEIYHPYVNLPCLRTLLTD